MTNRGVVPFKGGFAGSKLGLAAFSSGNHQTVKHALRCAATGRVGGLSGLNPKPLNPQTETTNPKPGAVPERRRDLLDHVHRVRRRAGHGSHGPPAPPRVRFFLFSSSFLLLLLLLLPLTFLYYCGDVRPVVSVSCVRSTATSRTRKSWTSSPSAGAFLPLTFFFLFFSPCCCSSSSFSSSFPSTSSVLLLSLKCSGQFVLCPEYGDEQDTQVQDLQPLRGCVSPLILLLLLLLLLLPLPRLYYC